MVSTRGVAKIIDFGLAPFWSDRREVLGSYAGTIEYSSPEQARGDVVDFRTDIYSLGKVLKELIAATDEATDSMRAQAMKVADAMMAEASAQRPKDMREVCERLDRINIFPRFRPWKSWRLVSCLGLGSRRTGFVCCLELSDR